MTMWPALRMISAKELALKNKEAEAVFVLLQSKLDKLMRMEQFTRTVGTGASATTITWEAALMPSIFLLLDTFKSFIKFNEGRESAVLANLPSAVDGLFAAFDTSKEPCLSLHEGVLPFAARLRGAVSERFCGGRTTRMINPTVHAAQLFSTSTCGDLLSWKDPAASAARIARGELKRVGETRLFEARNAAEVLIGHFHYRVRERELEIAAAAAAAAAGAAAPEFFDEQSGMDLAAMEKLSAAQAQVLDASVAAGPAPAPGAVVLTPRGFVIDVLEPLLYAASVRRHRLALLVEH